MDIKKLGDKSIKKIFSIEREALSNKVDKDGDKVLSDENYTSEEKTKLEGIETGAEANVNADYSVNDETDASYIKNRTHYTIPATVIAQATASKIIIKTGTESEPTYEESVPYYFYSDSPLILNKEYIITIGERTTTFTATSQSGFYNSVGVAFSESDQLYSCMYHLLYKENFATGYKQDESGEYVVDKVYNYMINPSDSSFVSSNELTITDKSSVVKLDNKYLNLSDWVFSETAPIPSKSDIGLGNVDNTSDADKPISTATQAALDDITELIPDTATSENKLIDTDTVNDLFNQNISDYISPNDSETSTPFQYTTYVAKIEDSTLPVLELGPWYKDGQSAGYVTGTSPRTGTYTAGEVSIKKGDWAIVQYDESVCYCFIHGYKYQRKKDGGATSNGTVVIPGVNQKYKSEHPTEAERRYDEITQYTIEGQTTPALGFGDWSTETYTKLGYYPVFIITSVITHIGVIYEFAADATFTPDLNPAHIKGTYDLSLPTTRYICTGTYEATGAPKFSFQYTLSDSAFTTPQLSSINSGATTDKINQIATNTSDITALKNINWKDDGNGNLYQNTVTYDSETTVPTGVSNYISFGSSNDIKSTGKTTVNILAGTGLSVGADVEGSVVIGKYTSVNSAGSFCFQNNTTSAYSSSGVNGTMSVILGGYNNNVTHNYSVLIGCKEKSSIADNTTHVDNLYTFSGATIGTTLSVTGLTTLTGDISLSKTTTSTAISSVYDYITTLNTNIGDISSLEGSYTNTVSAINGILDSTKTYVAGNNITLTQDTTDTNKITIDAFSSAITEGTNGLVISGTNKYLTTPGINFDNLFIMSTPFLGTNDMYFGNYDTDTSTTLYICSNTLSLQGSNTLELIANDINDKSGKIRISAKSSTSEASTVQISTDNDGTITLTTGSSTSGSIKFVAGTITSNGVPIVTKKEISSTVCSTNTYYAPGNLKANFTLDASTSAGLYSDEFSGMFTCSAVFELPDTTSDGGSVDWYGDTTLEKDSLYEFVITKYSLASWKGIITKLA